MTKFLDKSFSSRPATDAYRKGWATTFKPHPVQVTFISDLPIVIRGPWVDPDRLGNALATARAVSKRKAKKR